MIKPIGKASLLSAGTAAPLQNSFRKCRIFVSQNVNGSVAEPANIKHIFLRYTSLHLGFYNYS